MTGNRQVRFLGECERATFQSYPTERYEETRQSQDRKVRFVPTPFSPLLANIALHGME